MAARLSILVAWISTVLLFVPFWPDFPIAILDSSWKFGLNEAIARRLVFGKELIFGFGPLAPPYTRMYHPGTDGIMIGFGILFAVALVAGCTLISRGKRPYLLLALPIVLSQILFFDAVFLTIPFLFLLIVARWASNEPERPASVLAGIVLLGTTVSILPLVKGSFAGPALACGGLAWILIARRSRLLAAAALLWAVTAMAIAWSFTGQPLFALPGFFLSQSQIVSGYGLAMSLKGPMLQVIIFVLAAVSITRTFAAEASARFGKIAAAPILGMILTLFVAFKAGFVRHDIHPLIAASTLVLAAYCSLLMFRSQRVVYAMVVSVLVWSYIAYQQLTLSPNAVFNRLATALQRSSQGLMIRLSDKEAFNRKLDESFEALRQFQPLPAFNGTADIYPADILTVLANGQKWAPRPIVQSYSAYTPQLLEWNRQHLSGTEAPERIYFSISPIDGHYPSTEDGNSWIELISRYQVRSFLGPYAVLERRPSPSPVETDSVLLETGNGKLGSAVGIPPSDSPVWASMDIAPSWFGSIYGSIFKLPPLRLTIQYEDGTLARFRFIPGVAKSGFLLAPTVDTAAGFAALQRPRPVEYFKGRRPVNVEVTTKLWIQRLLWKGRHTIRLAELHVTPDPNIPPLPE